jgi:phospholipid/cholesterol/gamma-HCH transport system ATP-binding protein
MTEPLLTVRGLVKAYNGKTVLAGLDFEILRGECFVILGRSGSGKSVTLRLLNGLDDPDQGSVAFAGREVAAMTAAELRDLRRRVAMLFQSGALFDSMDVFENIAFPLREHTDLDTAVIAEKVREKLALVHLPGIEERLPSQLSGGMKKRVALARSLALDPDAVLFDEPTTGLDPRTAATIGELLRNARGQASTTAVVVTHDLQLARTVADRIAFLHQGRFVFLGTFAQAEASGHPELLAFLAGRADEEEIRDAA